MKFWKIKDLKVQNLYLIVHENSLTKLIGEPDFAGNFAMDKVLFTYPMHLIKVLIVDDRFHRITIEFRGDKMENVHLSLDYKSEEPLSNYFEQRLEKVEVKVNSLWYQLKPVLTLMSIVVAIAALIRVAAAVIGPTYNMTYYGKRSTLKRIMVSIVEFSETNVYFIVVGAILGILSILLIINILRPATGKIFNMQSGVRIS